MKKRIILFYLLFWFNFNCIYLQSKRIERIQYPETVYDLGFIPGKIDVNPMYAKIWCDSYCDEIKSIVLDLSVGYYVQIIGKVDGTDTLENRKKLSLGRARAIQELLVQYGVPKSKIKVIVDPEPNIYLGKDLFDPENRKVIFSLQKEK